MVALYTIVTIVALITSIAFVSLYSRYRWEDSPEGVNAMAFGIFIGVLASARIAQTLLGLGVIAEVVSVIAWVCLTALLIHRIAIIRGLHRNKAAGDKNNKEEARK